MWLVTKTNTAQKKFSSVNVTKSAGNLITFTEKKLNGKFRFLCGAMAKLKD